MKYRLRYLDKLRTPFDCRADNPLEIGTMLHEYIELGHDEAIANYVAKFPVLTDEIVDEAVKISTLGEAVKAVLPDGEYETELSVDGFTGYMDLLVDVGCGFYDLYDFKYSNNVNRYRESAQLDVYKFFFERANPGKKIRAMYFVVCPKVSIKRKKNESLTVFRERLREEAEGMKPTILAVDYDHRKVADFLSDARSMENASEFPKKETKLCRWCEYESFCLKGDDTMILPKNERREAKVITEPDMWLYADSYVGKSTFVDQMDDVLFINTDGNVENITSPYVHIANELVKEGRMTRKVLAWAKFKEVIDELEKKENDFQIIALDLIEDLYEHCRYYVFDQLGIRHESDGGFGKGWDMVRTEFLSTIKRLKSLGYRVIYISKELAKEITYANGMKVTTFAPNIAEKVANVLAGTVTMTLRAYMNERGHYLQLRKNENVFGGGRIDFKRDYCDLDVESFKEALIEAQEASGKPQKRRSAVAETTPANEAPEPEEEAEEAPFEADVVEEEPAPKTRVRRRSVEAAEEPAPAEEEAEEEQPKKRVRRRRVSDEG